MERENSRGLVHFLLATDFLFPRNAALNTWRLIKHDLSFALRSTRNLMCAPVRMNMATPAAQTRVKQARLAISLGFHQAQQRHINTH